MSQTKEKVNVSFAANYKNNSHFGNKIVFNHLINHSFKSNEQRLEFKGNGIKYKEPNIALTIDKNGKQVWSVGRDNDLSQNVKATLNQHLEVLKNDKSFIRTCKDNHTTPEKYLNGSNANKHIFDEFIFQLGNRDDDPKFYKEFDSWDNNKKLEYAKEQLDIWSQSYELATGKKPNLDGAVLHLDETCPHFHIMTDNIYPDLSRGGVHIANPINNRNKLGDLRTNIHELETKLLPKLHPELNAEIVKYNWAEKNPQLDPEQFKEVQQAQWELAKELGHPPTIKDGQLKMESQAKVNVFFNNALKVKNKDMVKGEKLRDRLNYKRSKLTELETKFKQDMQAHVNKNHLRDKLDLQAKETFHALNKNKGNEVFQSAQDPYSESELYDLRAQVKKLNSEIKLEHNDLKTRRGNIEVMRKKEIPELVNKLDSWREQGEMKENYLREQAQEIEKQYPDFEIDQNVYKQLDEYNKDLNQDLDEVKYQAELKHPAEQLEIADDEFRSMESNEPTLEELLDKDSPYYDEDFTIEYYKDHPELDEPDWLFKEQEPDLDEHLDPETNKIVPNDPEYIPEI